MSRLEEKMRLPDRGAKDGKNNLAILLSRIMTKIKLTTKKIEENNRAYVRNPLNQIPDDSGKRSSAAGNIRKEIERNTLTWRGFEKLIRWLQPKSAEVLVIIEWKDGKKTVDNVKIRIDDFVQEPDDEERNIDFMSTDEILEELRDRGVRYIIPGLESTED